MSDPTSALAEWHEQIWQALTRAPLDKHSAFRNATLCTVQNGLPQARIVVLREVKRELTRLTFFTDARTPKLAQLRTQTSVQWLLWDARSSLQLRVSATAFMEPDPAETARRWQRVSQGPSAGDYLSMAVPGQPLEPTQVNEVAAQAVGKSPQNHFAVVHSTVTEVDALQLSRGGHRRARFAYQHRATGVDDYNAQWLQA